MLDRSNSSPVERVTALVRELLAKRSVTRPVENDEDLAEAGLTSLDMVNLMLAVEAEFDLKIPDHDMTPANFRRAMFYGGVMGSFAVEKFGTERTQELTREEIDARFQQFRALSHLD